MTLRWGFGVLQVLESTMGIAFGSTFGWGKLSRHVKFEVDTGTDIRFWHDLWSGEVVLQEAFLELFCIARDKETLVADHLQVHTESIHWGLDFIRAV